MKDKSENQQTQNKRTKTLSVSRAFQSHGLIYVYIDWKLF